MKYLTLCVLVVSMASLACGSQSDSPVVNTATSAITAEPKATPTTAETIGKIGDTVTQGNYSITVVGVESAAEFGSFMKAETGEKLLAVELIVESKADTGVSVNPLYAKLKDANGYEYTSGIAGKEPTLKSQNDLPTGEKARGWVTFTIPETAKGLIFTYQPITFDSVRIRFDLGQ